MGSSACGILPLELYLLVLDSLNFPDKTVQNSLTIFNLACCSSLLYNFINKWVCRIRIMADGWLQLMSLNQSFFRSEIDRSDWYYIGAIPSRLWGKILIWCYIISLQRVSGIRKHTQHSQKRYHPWRVKIGKGRYDAIFKRMSMNCLLFRLCWPRCLIVQTLDLHYRFFGKL